MSLMELGTREQKEEKRCIWLWWARALREGYKKVLVLG